MVIPICFFLFKINRNIFSSSLTLCESSISSSSFDGPIRAPAPIIPLRAAHKIEGNLISDIPSILTEQDVDCFHDKYQISRETFHVFAPSSSVRVDDQIPVEDTIIVYKEQLKASFRFSMDPFFVEVLRFHRLVVAQLHSNSWRILVAF